MPPNYEDDHNVSNSHHHHYDNNDDDDDNDEQKMSSVPLTSYSGKTNEFESEQIRTVEDLYAALGNPGRFAVLVFLVVCFNMMTVASNHAAGVFLDYSPAHTCFAFGHNDSDVDHDGSLLSAPFSNNTSSARQPYGHVVNSDCSSSNITANETRTCGQGQWRYRLYERESSSVTEWDLVCDRANLAHLSSMLYYVGVMLGGLLFGYISDVIGRRKTMLVTLHLAVALGTAIAFTPSLIVYIVLRALMGIAIQGFLTATYIRLLELFGPKLRGFCGNSLYCLWGLSLNYLGLAAWLLRDWRFIQLACIAQALLGVFYIWFVPESLRWLIARAKGDEAAALAKRIYRINRCTDERCLDPKLMVRLTHEKEDKPPSIIDLFKTPALRRRTAILGFVTFAVNLGYWGLTYNTQALVGNRYQNFILNTLPEIFVYMANIYVLNKFGRKRPMVFYFCVTALACFISCVILSVATETVIAVNVVCTIGRLAASGLMGTNDVFMAELYPTVVRNTGVGSCVFVGRIGAVATPLIFSLPREMFRGLPLLIVGVITILGAAMTLLLPDTWQRDLPETLRDLDMTIEVTPDGEFIMSEKGDDRKDDAGLKKI